MKTAVAPYNTTSATILARIAVLGSKRRAAPFWVDLSVAEGPLALELLETGALPVGVEIILIFVVPSMSISPPHYY